MASDRIDSIILLEAIQKEFTAVSGLLTKLKTDISTVPQIKSIIENANAPRELAAATEKLATAQKNVAGTQQAVINGQQKITALQREYDGTIKSLNANIDANIKKQNDLKAAIKGIGEAQKSNTKDIESGAISADAYRKKQTELGEVLLKNKQRLSDVNAELKDQIKLQFATPGSIKEARVQNAQITRVRDNTQDPEKIRELNAVLDRNNELIDANSDKLGKQRINIGNYQGAANSIIDALGKQESKLQSLNSAYTSFGSQIAAQKNIISGFAGNVNSPEYKKATDKLKILEEGYRKTGIEAGKTRNVVEGFRRVADISSQSFTTAAGAQKALSDEAKNIGLTYGTNSEVFKEVNKVVGASTQEFNNVTKAVNASGKNADTAGGAFKKAFGGLRTLANIIPGIGISGLLLFAIEPIVDFIKFLTKATTTVFTYGEQLKLIRKINDEASVSGGKAVADLQIQKAAIESVLVPMKTRLQAIKDLKEEYPKYFENISTENLLNGQAAAAYDLASAAIIRKARAQAAASEIERLSGDNLKIQLEQTLKAEEATEKIRKAKDRNLSRSGGSSSFTGGGSAGTEVVITKAEQEKRIREDFAREDSAAKKKVDLNNKAINLLIGLTQFGADATIKIEKEKEAKTDGSLSNIQQRKKTRFEQDKIRLERQLRLLDADIKDEKTYYLEKLTLLEEFGAKQKELLALQAAEDIKNKSEEAAREVANLNDSKKGKSRSQIGRIDQNIAIVEKNNADAIKLVRVKLADDILKIDEKQLIDKKSILKAELKAEEDLAKDILDLEQKLQDNIDKIRDRQLKRIKEGDKLELDALQAKENIKAQIISDSAKGIEEILFGAIDAKAEREKAELDRQIENIDKKAQADIAAITASGLAESEKLKLITGIEKESVFQKEQIEKRKTDIEKKQRTARKIGAIAEIATNTAISIFDITRKAAQAKAQAALLASNPFTAAAAPGALAAAGLILTQIPVVLAGAAINLARVAFFAKGTQNAPAGPAVYGEQGSELVLEKSGRAYLTPPQATLTQLAGGEKIFPADVTKMIMNSADPYAMMMQAMKGNKSSASNDAITKRDIDRLIRSNENKPKIENTVNFPIENTPYYWHHIKN